MSSAKKPGKQEATGSTTLAQLKNALTDKRARRAWGLAKELFKEFPENALPREELRNAFIMRMQSLYNEKMPREAAQMYDQVTANRPWLANPLPLPLRLSLGRDGAKIIPDTTPAGDGNEELERSLRQDIVDLRSVADCPILPADNPWRIEARLLLDAWAVLEKGEPLPSLQAVGRRSPLLAWRLFIQALEAFYHRDQAQLEANAGRIPADSPLHPVGEYLRTMGGGGKLPVSGWQKELAEKMGAGKSLHGRLTAIEKLYRSGIKKPALAQLGSICTELAAAGRRALAVDLLIKISMAEADIRPLIKSIPFVDANAVFFILRDFASDPEALARSMMNLLDDGKLLSRLSQLEQALAISAIAQVNKPDDRHFLSFLKAKLAHFDQTGEIDPDDEDFNAEFDAEFDAEYGSHDQGALFVRSLEALPLASTFNAYVRWLEKNAPEKIMPLLKKWRTCFPDDPEPLRRELKLSLLGGNPEKLFDTFWQLREMLGSGHTDLRRCQAWVAARYLLWNRGKAKNTVLARQLLEAGTGMVEVCLRHVVELMLADAPQERMEIANLLDLRHPLLIRQLLLHFNRRKNPSLLGLFRGQATESMSSWADEIQEGVKFFSEIDPYLGEEFCQNVSIEKLPTEMPLPASLDLLHFLVSLLANCDGYYPDYNKLLNKLTERLIRMAAMEKELPVLLYARAFIWYKLAEIKMFTSSSFPSQCRHAIILMRAALALEKEHPLSPAAKNSIAALERIIDRELLDEVQARRLPTPLEGLAIAITEARFIGRNKTPTKAEIIQTSREMSAGLIHFPPPLSVRLKKTRAKPGKKKAGAGDNADKNSGQPLLF